ncbi:MAG: maleylpyruvate isomerase N-terminal domain-containing protein [Streptosporangiaceae bacterium]
MRLDGQDTRGPKAAEMGGNSGRGHPGTASEFAGGESPAVQQGSDHRDSGRIGEQLGCLGNICIHSSTLPELSSLDNEGKNPSTPWRTRPMPMPPAAPEIEPFLDALQSTPPGTLSACAGWTAHEVTAHLAAGAAEVSRHLDPFIQGDSVPATRGFEEREAPYRALGDPVLRKRLASEVWLMQSLIAQVLHAAPDAVIAWTGRQMPVAKFAPHMASEFAVHRWDIAGGPGDALLAQPMLLEHAVSVLGPLLLRRGVGRDPRPGQDLAVRLRSDGQRDVRVTVQAGQAGISLEDDRASGDEPWLECEPAARLLVVWGRRPDRRDQLTSHMPGGTLVRLLALLAGY